MGPRVVVIYDVKCREADVQEQLVFENFSFRLPFPKMDRSSSANGFLTDKRGL